MAAFITVAHFGHARTIEVKAVKYQSLARLREMTSQQDPCPLPTPSLPESSPELRCVYS